MATIESGFANMIGNVSSGFSNSILGQASYIDRLQQGAGGAPPSAGSPLEQALRSSPTKQAFVDKLAADPNLAQQAQQAMQKDPNLLRRAIQELAKAPQLARGLPPSLKQFFVSALQR